MNKKGWLEIPGVQSGDRTLKEQMLGLESALAECDGKTVLDLGCAEGLIALEFAKAGAKSVFGCDYKQQFIEVANQQAVLNPELPVTFEYAEINEKTTFPQFDIVLALAILHKLDNPSAGVELCCKVAKELIVIRLPIGSTGAFRSKHLEHRYCDIRTILTARGFVRERKEAGPRGEWVQYWRKVK